jgi:hypothetical protein
MCACTGCTPLLRPSYPSHHTMLSGAAIMLGVPVGWHNRPCLTMRGLLGWPGVVCSSQLRSAPPAVLLALLLAASSYYSYIRRPSQCKCLARAQATILNPVLPVCPTHCLAAWLPGCLLTVQLPAAGARLTKPSHLLHLQHAACTSAGCMSRSSASSLWHDQSLSPYGMIRLPPSL